MIEIETKIQTIYYETTTGEISKFYSPSKRRLTLEQADKILHENDLPVFKVIRVMTERVFVKLSLKVFEESVTHTERYYKN